MRMKSNSKWIPSLYTHTLTVTCSGNGSWFRGYQCLQNKRKRRDRAWNSRTKLPPKSREREKEILGFLLAFWKRKLHTYIAAIEGTRTPQPKRKRYTKSENILTANIPLFLSIFQKTRYQHIGCASPYLRCMLA